ncbi:acyltransferase family protein [Pseudomonas turukhanskensis]|uniref:Acyltransferase 3 domain-containing protein n=1 Tax=Pseudomonas turukhanskensis TaxID=1806536 RepID=A0A9W6K3I3_9PSED|nr:acyltransferase [Pseudomonas turukhanskensis]GLK88097.1 hypothetical protein GCM10017655_11590 [Pseudomonas turukhanskensis]
MARANAVTDRATPATDRQAWIDTLRGTSIILVILVHTASFAGFNENDTLLFARLIDGINDAAAPLRMEIMFLLSGFFVSRGLSKGWRQYNLGKVNNILYPFVVWSLIAYSINKVGATFFGGRWGDWYDLLRLLVGATDYTWFLYDLFVFYLITPLLRRYNPLLVVGLALVIAFSLPREWFMWLPGYGDNVPGFERPIYKVNDLFYYFIFFFAGDYLVKNRIDLKAITHPAALALSAAAALTVLGLGYFNVVGKTWPGYAPLVLAALPIFCKVAVVASNSLLSAPVTYIGRNSIVFYLVHYPLYMVLVFVLKKLGIVDSSALFLLLLSAGLLVPLLVVVIKNTRQFNVVSLLFSPEFLMERRDKPLASEA